MNEADLLWKMVAVLGSVLTLVSSYFAVKYRNQATEITGTIKTVPGEVHVSQADHDEDIAKITETLQAVTKQLSEMSTSLARVDERTKDIPNRLTLMTNQLLELRR